ncbi:MAG: carboxypeptidase-like regulatory domain-containing protein [Planctomycetaceae bacterium]|jgi:hypothetical protein|nr:carboxypeptidase-like regulatory domain-containing protein [Planctomycetaceae bacterium]
MKVVSIDFVLFLVCCLIFVSGCNKGDPVVPVSGTVTLQGKPIADCSITFQPTAKNQIVAASGLTNAEGNFSLETIESPRRKGAVAGEYQVKFFWRDPDFDEAKPKPIPYQIPAKYQQEGISFTVPNGGQTDIVFDLVP